MNKSEFLSSLNSKLSQLPENERQKHLDYYSELIDDMTEDGMTQQEAVEKLGDVQKLAEQILCETPLPLLVKNTVKPKNGWNALTVILLILASPIWLPVAAALICVCIAVYAVIWAVIVVFFAVVAALVLGGLSLAVLAFSMNMPSAASLCILLGSGLACIGLGVMAFLGAAAAARYLVKLTSIFGKWIKSLFIRKEKRA